MTVVNASSSASSAFTIGVSASCGVDLEGALDQRSLQRDKRINPRGELLSDCPELLSNLGD